MKNFFIVIGSIFFSLFLLELLFRVLPTNQGTKIQQISEDNNIRYYLQNRDFLWSRGWNFKIKTKKKSNNYGFFNDSNYVKNSKTKKIIVIGDSYVAASQIANNDTFFQKIEKEKNYKNKIYSLATDGSAFPDYLQYFNFSLSEFNPEKIIFVIVNNDFDESICEYRDIVNHYYFCIKNKKITVKKKVDQLEDFIIRKFGANSSIVHYIFYNLNINLFKLLNLLKISEEIKIKKEVDLNKIKLGTDFFLKQIYENSLIKPENILFITDARRSKIYNQQIFNSSYFKKKEEIFYEFVDYFILSAKKYNFKVIDLHNIFKKDYLINNNKFEYEIDMHWNEYAHDLISKEIIRNGFL